MSENQTSRRDFLRASVLTSALFGAEGALSGKEGRGVAGNGGEARNVILMVSDGMNHGALSLARQYQGLVVQEESKWMRLYGERRVGRCLVETCPAKSCGCV